MKEDTFFTQETCDRCGQKLNGARIMSMFNTECICVDCLAKEKKHKDYERARDAERDAVAHGDTNFPGIGKPSDL